MIIYFNNWLMYVVIYGLILRENFINEIIILYFFILNYDMYDIVRYVVI